MQEAQTRSESQILTFPCPVMLFIQPNWWRSQSFRLPVLHTAVHGQILLRFPKSFAASTSALKNDIMCLLYLSSGEKINLALHTIILSTYNSRNNNQLFPDRQTTRSTTKPSSVRTDLRSSVLTLAIDLTQSLWLSGSSVPNR